MFGTGTPIFHFRGPMGVPVEIHSSILLLVLIFMGFGGSAGAMLYSALFVVIIIGSIFLHELGHAWGNLVQGIPVRRIVIYGGGGFCESARSGSRYEQELVVAMGPIVNIAIWAVASLVWPYLENPTALWAVLVLAQVNLFLAVLNMLPVHPLDGGKLFQLGLMRLMPARQATKLSGMVGLVIAVLWIPAMIWSFLTLGLVLFFIPSIRAHWEMARI